MLAVSSVREAGTIAELIRYRTPALLIPYPYAADDHQRINGTFLAKEAKGARMVVQTEASPERMAEEIAQLIQEKRKCAARSNRRE